MLFIFLGENDERITKIFLILINVLNSNGGVMINRRPYVLTEDLSWINSIGESPLRLGKSKDFIPQVIAFYHGKYSISREFFNIEPYEGM